MHDDAPTTDNSTQPWDTLTYVRTCTLKRVKLWQRSSCGAGFCLGGSRAGVFHRDVQSWISVFLRVCVRATNPYLHLPSQFVPPPLCNGSVDQEQPGEREARFFVLFPNGVASDLLVPPCFVLFCLRLESLCAVGSQFTYCALPALSPPGGRKPQWKLEPCVAVYSDWQET